ncbi:MAG: glycosyltransferase [Dermatophilaceae bacterium]
MRAPILSLILVPGDEKALEVSVSTIFRDHADTRWELVLASGQEPDSLSAIVQRAPAGRLRWVQVQLAENAADSCALSLQRALDASTGAYVAVVGTGDIVEPGVLPAVVDYLASRPLVDVLYTDEQWPAEAAEGIFTKPGWNAEYLLGLPYLGRLCFVRREPLMSCGGFRAGTSGAEEWDMHLRVTDAGAVVEHIPSIGLTRPNPPCVTTDSQVTALRVVEAHFHRIGVEARVEAAALPGSVRSWRSTPECPLVSVVMPTIGARRAVRGEDTRLVTNCVRSLLAQTTYDNWELVLVTSEGTPAAAIDEVAALAGKRLTVAPVTGAFNFSRSINEGARVARGSHLLLLNDDTEVIEPLWLERMVGVAQDPTIGAVGAKLLFEDSRIQHIGVVHNDVWEPAHAFEFTPDDGNHFGMGTLDMDYLAVTGACLLTPRDVFLEVGGLTVELPLNYNDVDFCFKVIHSGRRIVSTPFARLHHYESASRDAHLEPFERAFLREHWTALAHRDPFVNLREIR